MSAEHVYLEWSEDHRGLGGWGGALEACRKLGRWGQLEGCRRGLGSDWRLGRCGGVRDAVNRGSGGGLCAAEGLGVERCHRFGHRRRCCRHLHRRRRRRRSRLRHHRDLGSQLERLQVDFLGLGLVALDEEGAIDLDRIHGAGEPMEHEALGVRVGARLSEREELGDHIGL